ncbi:MAG: SET domain-containing protein-lysine N-methyltransferase [Candidatus Protistobacter heckmanni]|nr:SET domain-containing protein-lysine N-methyltransferase [Candidatus Protistobacter heckmanni]
MHGRGVFALRELKTDKRIIEYKGRRISWKQAMRKHPHDPDNPNHTFFFSLEDDRVIDGGDDGNNARWINHSCEPNCEAREKRDKDGKQRVHIYALRKIKAGEELFYDYGLVIEGRQTKKLKKEYECRCGNKNCRGTMLAPKEK